MTSSARPLTIAFAVQEEAFRYLQRDRRRHRELRTVHDCVDENRAVMRERGRNAVLDLGRIFKPDSSYADGFGHGLEARAPEPVL
jgi:hypothetical protein